MGMEKTETLLDKLDNNSFPTIVVNIHLSVPKVFVTDYFYDFDAFHKGTLDFIKVKVVGESYSKTYTYTDFTKDYVEYTKKYVALHFPDWEP